MPPIGVDERAWAQAPQQARAGVVRLIAALRDANRSQIAVAAVLAEAERGRWAEAFGFDDVDAFAYTVFGVSRRKTRTLIDIYRKFVEDLEVPIDTLASIPWTKLAAVLHVAMPATVKDWLRRAEQLPVRMLVAEVRQHRTGHAPVARVSKTFAIQATAESIVEMALERIGHLANTDDRGRQLELLAAESLAGANHDLIPAGHSAFAVYLPVADYQRLVAALLATGEPTLERALMTLVTGRPAASALPASVGGDSRG